MKTLEIKWAHSKRRGKRLDFYVSGRSLLKAVERRGYDLVPRLGSELLPIDMETRALLLLEKCGDTPGGRVGLYVCPLCGDYGCGVVSVRITREGSDILWSEIGYENGHDEGFLQIEKLGPFRFDEKAYRQALMTAGSSNVDF
jgi:hypothetical protein